MNAQDNAIAKAYGEKFIVPLDLEMLDSLMPCYQAGLGLCYEMTFNSYGGVNQSTGASPDATYKIMDITLEYKIVTQPDIASSIAIEYQSIVLFYDRILRHRQIPVNKNDTTWNWSFNTPCKSLKGILVLFEDVKDTGKLYNPSIQKVSVIVEGKPNQLYAQGMRSIEQCDKICKYFAEGRQRDTNTNEVQKQLKLHDLSVREYLDNKYALWLNFRTIDKNALHGMGRRKKTHQEESPCKSRRKLNRLEHLAFTYT